MSSDLVTVGHVDPTTSIYGKKYWTLRGEFVAGEHRGFGRRGSFYGHTFSALVASFCERMKDQPIRLFWTDTHYGRDVRDAQAKETA